MLFNYYLNKCEIFHINLNAKYIFWVSKAFKLKYSIHKSGNLIFYFIFCIHFFGLSAFIYI